MNLSCSVCKKRRAKRDCPGVGGGICPSCCGAEREVTIDCPLDCAYLRDARRHERVEALDPESFPNKDIRVSDEFLRKNEQVFLWLLQALLDAMESGKAVDPDAREALDALVKTYRTRESGLIYETRPANPYAARIQERLNAAVEELRKHIAEESGMNTLRDADVLGVLVFLQRLELQYSNGRRRGRAFFDFLSGHFPAQPEGATEPGIATPPEPSKLIL